MKTMSMDRNNTHETLPISCEDPRGALALRLEVADRAPIALSGARHSHSGGRIETLRQSSIVSMVPIRRHRAR
jgi:hypothetical protein